MRTEAASPPLQTVDRCLQVLLLYTDDTPEWTPTKAARELGLPKTIVHRMLRSLTWRGFLVQDPQAGSYRLGLPVLALGHVAQRALPFRQARPVLRDLARDVDECVIMSVRDGDSAVTVEKVETFRHPIRLTLDVGSSAPLHAGASQRCLLAYLSDAEREAYLAGPLTLVTPCTTVDPDALSDVLNKVRERGYDFSIGELTPGVAALAVPIFGLRGTIVASLTIGGLAERFSEARIQQHLPQLHAAAREVEHQLGSR